MPILSNQGVSKPFTATPRSASPRALLHLAVLSLALGAVLALAPGTARAQSQLSVLGEGEVKELSHKRSLTLSAEAIEVVETITLGSVSKVDVLALYTFDLPAQAAITELRIESATGQKSVQGVVGALAATERIDDASYSPDMGVLRMIASEGDDQGDRKRYELRVFPVPAQKSSTVTLHWTSPLQLLSGSYSVRLPGRGDGDGLARTEVLLTCEVALESLYGGDKLLATRAGKGQRFTFFAPASGDLVVQGVPSALGTQARAEIALLPLSATSGVAAIRVLVPDTARSPAPPIERVLVLIDVSRSLDSEGLVATGTVVDGLLAGLGSGTQVEAIVFDRQAQRVLGSFQPGDRSQRSQILRAIQSAKGANGSDLSAALTLAKTVLAETKSARPGRSLVAIISDGMLPTTLSGDEASDALGVGATLPRVLAAVLVPDNAPLPALQESALGTMAFRSKGRVVALRYRDAESRSKALLDELAQPAPLQNLQVEFDRGSWVGADLAGMVSAGSSVTGLGYYQGGTPTKITIRGKRDGVLVTLPVRKLGTAPAMRLAQMTLAATPPDSFPGVDAGESLRAMQAAAVKLGVVTQVSAAVAVDQGDGFARDRLAMAKKWGAQFYRRMPPPAERALPADAWQRFAMRSSQSRSERGRTGQLDSDIVASRVKAHVIPLARACYERQLRRDPKAAGTLELHIEVARGEVQHAAIPRMPLALAPIRECVLDAIYAMPIPRVRLGDDLELVSIAKYPLRFRMKAAGKGHVAPGGKASDSTGELDPNDPLSGLPD